MANRLLIRAFIRAAKLQATAVGNGATITSILEGIVLGRFNDEATEGKTIVKTSHAGHEVEFALPKGLTATDVLELAEAALQELERQTDPDNPTFSTRKIRRLRANFDPTA